MPKGRMLNKKISRSEQLSKLSVHAALLFSWCIPQLDSEGRTYADAISLKGMIVPYLEYMTIELIGKCVEEICQTRMAIVYGNGKYMQFLGFASNQRIDKTKEAASEIPPPTPDELRLNSRVTPDTSKVKLSKVKLSKAEPSAALTAALDKIYNKGKGLNIYALMSRLKKQAKQPNDWQFPEEVLLRVCMAYEQDKGKIGKPWPWFVKVIKTETALWHAQQNINAHKKYKKDKKFFQPMKDILGIGY